jgi:hypothetical protein
MKIVIIGFLISSSICAQDNFIINPGFESDSSGWNNLTRDNNESYAPVDGEWIAVHKGNGAYTYQETDQIIEAGKTYTFNLWARSINEPGITAATIAEARIYSGSTTFAISTKNVNAPQLKGAAAEYANDDGANIWVDGEYRHQLNDKHMYQPISSDPIEDPWFIVDDNNYEKIKRLGWAVGNVIAGENKYVYGTIYRDRPENFYSSITMSKVLSSYENDYIWSDPITLISHSKTEFPWVEDPHCYYDESTERLWMSWGGGVCYVSELDPQTGLFINNPPDPEFDTHPKDMHRAVATWPETREGWCGDQWSVCWMEGAALYKHNGYWYYLASYGNMNKDYTIRYGRGESPIGPFYDKNGLDMMKFDPARNVFGNTILLAAEGNQLVPGHPHIWEENGNFYLGYDYRSDLRKEKDMMGIRRLYWVNGWPTIYIPVTVTYKTDDHPESIGKKLGVSFRNIGAQNSLLAVDNLTVSIQSSKKQF